MAKRFFTKTLLMLKNSQLKRNSKISIKVLRDNLNLYNRRNILGDFMNGNTKEIKYTLAREEMIELLEKYPFLVYRNIYSGEKTHDTLDEDIEYNEWTSWDGSGWEHIWKRYLTYLFIEYDKLNEKIKKDFMIFETKEKYGSFRCYTSFGNKEIFELENKLGMISKWTCIRCGKQPKNSKGQHIIWRTTGWICPYCKECFKKEISGNDWSKKKERKWQKDMLQECKEVKKRDFAMLHYDYNTETRISYGDLWDF